MALRTGAPRISSFAQRRLSCCSGRTLVYEHNLRTLAHRSRSGPGSSASSPDGWWPSRVRGFRFTSRPPFAIPACTAARGDAGASGCCHHPALLLLLPRFVEFLSLQHRWELVASLLARGRLDRARRHDPQRREPRACLERRTEGAGMARRAAHLPRVLPRPDSSSSRVRSARASSSGKRSRARRGGVVSQKAEVTAIPRH